MKQFTTIGHIGHGETTLTAAIKIVLEKEGITVLHDLSEPLIIDYKAPLFLLDSRTPSKTRLKKCEKGLHEYKESPFTGVNEGGFSYKKWACIHCGSFMHNRG